jgi:hypothetical protein
MTKAIALPIKAPLDGAAITQGQVTRRKRPSKPRTWVQIRTAVVAMRREGAPFDVLTHAQIFKRLTVWMTGQGATEHEIPSRTSFDRHLPSVLAEVLASGSIG